MCEVSGPGCPLSRARTEERPLLNLFSCQTAIRDRPYCLKGAGYAFIPFPQQTKRGGGAPKGAPTAAPPCGKRGASSCDRGRSPCGAPHAAFFLKTRDRSSVRGWRALAPPDPGDFRLRSSAASCSQDYRQTHRARSAKVAAGFASERARVQSERAFRAANRRPLSLKARV